MVSKQALINGLSNYIHQMVLPSITDVWNKRIMDGAMDLLVMHPEYFDRLMEKYPIVDMVCVDGMYDIDALEEVVRHNIDSYGPITIKLLGGSYTFDANDISNLRRMM